MKTRADLRIRKVLFREFDRLAKRHGRAPLLNAMRKYVDIDRARRGTLRRIIELRRQLQDVIGGKNGRK